MPILVGTHLDISCDYCRAHIFHADYSNITDIESKIIEQVQRIDSEVYCKRCLPLVKFAINKHDAAVKVSIG